ncbi:MAG: phage tail assembly protein [Beijerinckiaceae bacterium]|nr:phage tail assembly protein [Beijerinckiaceae bacterium]
MNDEAHSESTPTPAPRFVDTGKARTKTVMLEWPVEFDGKVWSEITIRRLTAAEVDMFVEDAREAGAKARLPMFDAPFDVLDALDSDDAENLNREAEPFLPLAFRARE